MTATQKAYSHAKERILDGRLAGGELISEGEVAGAVGVSRTPVREAFLRLESEGLLPLYPKRGALVIPVSAAEVESVMETRLLVECFALEKVIRSDTPVGDAPEQAITRQADLAARGDLHGFVEADRAFHRVYVAAARNPILLALHDSLRDKQTRMGVAALTHDAARIQQIMGEHRAIAAAVTERDEAAARTMIGAHVETTQVLLRLASLPEQPT